MKWTVQSTLLCSLLVACQTLSWHGPRDYSDVEGCRGGTVNMSWGYTLRPGERVEDIKWHFTDHYGVQHLIAMETEGQFVVLHGQFSDRLQQVNSAGLELRYIRQSDSGQYTVTVSTHDGFNNYFTDTLTAFLNVSEPPSVRGGELEVSQSPDAVYSNDTGQWHVQLKCGHFYSLGQPPVSVVWTTPSGLKEWSDSSEDGQFTLLLSNPVQDGNYTCNVSRDNDPAARCLPSYSPLTQGSSVTVDGVSTSFTLLQAQQTLLLQDTGRLGEENNQLTHALDNLQRSVDTRLASLEAQVSRLQGENRELQTEVSELKTNERRVDQLVNTVDSLTQQLQWLLDHREYFTTGLPIPTTLSTSSTSAAPSTPTTTTYSTTPTRTATPYWRYPSTSPDFYWRYPSTSPDPYWRYPSTSPDPYWRWTSTASDPYWRWSTTPPISPTWFWTSP